jgi:arylsulfatase
MYVGELVAEVGIQEHRKGKKMTRPNILVILNDDMGFSDLGCYGGEVYTPNLDGLAQDGLRLTQFYNTARCCPSRASLLTGLHPHQADVGHMMLDDGVDGYLGDLNQNAVTIAEVLREAGYATFMSGKWHVTRHFHDPKHNWPCQRGFDEFYGILTGACSFYQPNTLTRDNEHIETPPGPFFLTDAIGDEAADQIRRHAERRPGEPFFQYVAYTAPHWPLHAHPDDVARHDGRFDRGWDVLREERLQRLIAMGIIHPDWRLSPRDPTQPPWQEAQDKEWQVRRMEVYAAQIDRMDQGIGRVLEALRETGQWENTVIIFLSDNGGCAEEIQSHWEEWLMPDNAQPKTSDGTRVQFGNDPRFMPGGADTYQSYGIAWANLSNTPFREYKHWVHEGGIATPFIVHWPEGIIDGGGLRHEPAQLPDIMATCIELAEAEYPETYNGRGITPLEGFSMLPIFQGEPFARPALVWEHEGNAAVREGKWKLVRKFPGGWELYDMVADRTELNDLSAEHPGQVGEMLEFYEAWAERCGVMPWAELLALRRGREDGSKEDGGTDGDLPLG